MYTNRISNLMKKAVTENIFPGGVLLCAKKKGIVFHEAYGNADLFEPKKMDIDTIFDLASLTKPLATTLVIAKLVEQNKIHINQKISSILKEFESSKKGQITIDMLLRHTSGLPAYKEYYKKLQTLNKNPRQTPRQTLRQFLIQEKLENPIGIQQEYSDIGFMILAWVIETTTGKRLDEIAHQYIYQPLHIENIFFIDLQKKQPVEPAVYKKIAATQNCPWRKKLLKGEVDDDNTWSVGGIEGHAGLFGDAHSVYMICAELLDAIKDRSTIILNSEIIKDFIQKKGPGGMVAGFDTPSKINSSAGKFFSPASIGHLGYTGTSFWIDPEAELITILLTNRVHPSRSNESIKKFRPKLHDLIRSTIA